MLGEVTWIDQDDGFGDALRRQAVVGEELTHGQDVGCGLIQRRGDLGGVGLSVDDGEGFDLDDVEVALILEGDDIRLEVDLVACDGQAQHGVVEQGAVKVRPAVCCAEDAGPGAGVASFQGRLVLVAADAVDVLIGHLGQGQAKGLA